MVVRISAIVRSKRYLAGVQYKLSLNFWRQSCQKYKKSVIRTSLPCRHSYQNFSETRAWQISRSCWLKINSHYLILQERDHPGEQQLELSQPGQGLLHPAQGQGWLVRGGPTRDRRQRGVRRGTDPLGQGLQRTGLTGSGFLRVLDHVRIKSGWLSRSLSLGT